MKKLLSLLLSILMICSIGCVNVFADIPHFGSVTLGGIDLVSGGYWINDSTNRGKLTATGASSTNFNVAYDATTNTLTLKNFNPETVSGDSTIVNPSNGLRATVNNESTKATLKIVVSGTNNIKTGETGVQMNYNAIYAGFGSAKCKVEICGDNESGVTNSLNLYANRSGDYLTGVTANGGIEIKDVDLYIKLHANESFSCIAGLKATDGDVLIDNCNVQMDLSRANDNGPEKIIGIYAGDGTTKRNITVNGSVVNMNIDSGSSNNQYVCAFGGAPYNSNTYPFKPVNTYLNDTDVTININGSRTTLFTENPIINGLSDVDYGTYEANTKKFEDTDETTAIEQQETGIVRNIDLSRNGKRDETEAGKENGFTYFHSTNTYKIEYELDDGIVYDPLDSKTEKPNPTSYTKTTETFSLNPPTKLGYTFSGWKLPNTEDSTATTTVTIPKGSKGNKKFIAVYTVINYNITYHLDGGDNNTSNPATYTVEDTVNYLNPTKDGYTFVGWYSNADLTNSTTGINKGSTGDVDVYAKWKEKEYTITYHLNGGTNNAANPTSYTKNDVVTFKDPSWGGHTFLGWYSDPDCTVAITGIPVGSKGNVDIYAKWKTNSYQVVHTGVE